MKMGAKRELDQLSQKQLVDGIMKYSNTERGWDLHARMLEAELQRRMGRRVFWLSVTLAVLTAVLAFVGIVELLKALGAI